jgi:hypothetical protein
MRNYKVTYLQEDYSIRVKFIAANSADEARALVYGDTVGCIQTFKAELVNSSPTLNGDMANEFNDSFHSEPL